MWQRQQEEGQREIQRVSDKGANRNLEERERGQTGKERSNEGKAS